MRKLFNFFRGFKPKKTKIYPRTYEVRVSLSHPRIIGHIITVNIAIDAHSSSHAHRQLKNELELKVGKVVKSYPTNQ